MNNEEHINKMAEEALSSFEGAGRAMPKPYLLTRIKARMERKKETAWQTASSFITRPAFVMAGLCLVIVINALVISFDNTATENIAATEEQTSTDEFSTTVATLYDIENPEP